MEVKSGPSGAAPLYHVVVVYSDPPGAHVYGDDGRYWGQTERTQPVVREFTGSGGQRWGHYRVTLKKRGYKTTSHTWSWPWRHPTKEAAYRHKQKLVVVLDVN
jgi:hypothetical protein